MSLDRLLEAARQGGAQDRRALIDAIEAKLHGFFRARCGTWDVDDLVQDSFVVLLRRIDTFVPVYPGAFEDFVIMVARFELLSQRRAWARERARRVGAAPVLADSPRMTSLVNRNEVLSAIQREIAALRTGERRTILAWLRSELGPETAELEGVAAVTLRTRLHRALARLRRVVGRTTRRFAPEPT